MLAALTRLEAGQASVELRLASLQTGQSSLHNDLTSLRVDLMQRMDRLQNASAAIRDDVGVNMARTERAHDAVANTRDELRSLGQEVAAAFRKIRQLEDRVREITGDP